MDDARFKEIKARLLKKLEIADHKGIRLGQGGNQASSLGGHLHNDIRALLDRVEELERKLAEAERSLTAANERNAKLVEAAFEEGFIAGMDTTLNHGGTRKAYWDASKARAALAAAKEDGDV
jgi:hypothetical protein